ncbi:MAG: OsmC family protein [Gammaproteobacteria bacterium]|nr:OsmC family protein [Gammaproteobacteria bacterium]MDE2349058.1 OsmC family protein [Gammaproteobacteria bacterium]
MQAYPHHYVAAAHGAVVGMVSLQAPGLPAIETAAPPEFDGPGGVWSPESMLVAAVADCFILTFRSIARAAHFEWLGVECRVDGVLDRVSGVARFTRFSTSARLTVAPGSDGGKARTLLERAEKLCLISNSLSGERHLELEIVNADAWRPLPPPS